MIFHYGNKINKWRLSASGLNVFEKPIMTKITIHR